ncbi:MAG: folylpolyglutamate synthase/dihydrofolate synthase family protein [Verrucomicrobiota bacterium]
MTYAEAIRFLYDLRWFGAKLGLENTFKLAALAGNPQEQLRFIHVAGTNGKGSVCAMLESIYRTAGLRVGLFTSPHLVAFGERIQVNRHLIDEEEVTRLVSEVQALLGAFPASAHPTFFEVVTVMALRYFAEQQCNLVIWETGLGGRLDATNIVIPLASVITNIQFDHEKWLGPTLAEIAFEKAGIIKPGIPVITATDQRTALQVIAETAKRHGSPLIVVTRLDTARPPLDAIALPLRGEHQRLNAAVTLATVRTLAPELPVTEEAMVTGLSQVDWPGRLQLETTVSGQSVLLDGAHNPAGAESLRAVLQTCFPTVKPTLILGILRDKDCEAICQILAPLANHICLAPVASDRTAVPEELKSLCRKAHPEAQVAVCSGLAEALTLAADAPFLVITGSLHFVGEAMELLRLLPGKAAEERSLNEWKAAP